MADKGVDQSGVGCLNLGPYPLGGGPVGPIVRVVNVGDEPPYWEGVGVFHHRVVHRLMGTQPW